MNGTQPEADAPANAAGVCLFLCGDVMTGRGIDQVLPHPSKPHLFEPWARSALQYVELAERSAGAIGRGLDFAYPWGDALAVLGEQHPDARLINLETAVTTSEDAQPGKGIHYRMHPDNLPCLTHAGIDCCVLANNHVMDWGPAGLEQTLAQLHAAGLRTAGAGANAQEAAAPAVIIPATGARVLVFAVAHPSSGTPEQWAAGPRRAGVGIVDELSAHSAQRLAALTARHRRVGDIVLVSVHWGGNWGFDIAPAQQAFARTLIEAGAADVVWGHSSHHVKGTEVHRGKLILYGCGDLINDYEGIGGHTDYRAELSLMYFPRLDAATGALLELRMAPMRMHRFRLERAPAEGRAWLLGTLEREGRALGTSLAPEQRDGFSLRWQGHARHA